MAQVYHNGFMQSIKGKVVFTFALACFALFLAWGISKIAFKEMLVAVENISTPNDKLRIVNELSRKVGQLDQLQKTQLQYGADKYYNFFKESKKLNLTIDTLQSLYKDDSVQLARIGALKKLLRDRDKLFINYLKVRDKLVNNKYFSAQVQSLDSLVDIGSKQTDSTVVTTEKKTSTTIIYPEKSTQKDSRSFLSKLFGKKKKEQQSNEPYKVVSEELNIQRDTVAKAIKDSIMHSMSVAMRKMENNQRRKTAQFVNRETVLANANNKLVRQILSILKQVEAEVVAQIEFNNSHAKAVVNTSVKRISLIMLAFFLVTVILIYFILTDITQSNIYRKELEKARDAAEYHSMAKQRFLSNMSHEIRTPLQSIIGYSELIRQQEHPGKTEIDAIYQSSGHLLQIVNEVLDYNRIISGKFTFTNQPFNMAHLINEVASVMRLQADKKSLGMIVNYSNAVNTNIEGDPFRLKQVLYNLLGNAIKFTNTGQITLSVSCVRQEEGAYFTFSVIDTGIGMDSGDSSRIFNEFEQIENADINNQTGTGLGLAISKELIESQGGSIYVKSELGKGACFTFHLKFTIIKEAANTIETPVSISLNANNGKVWIVDDDNFILELCSLIFEKNSITHRCFNSPAQVLNIVWDSAVKYILLDIRMPGMNGKELCMLLRKKIPVDVKIYALTAQVMAHENETILSAGFDGLLIKPFKEKELLALFNNDCLNEQNIDINLDISAVEKMAFGDKAQLVKVLNRFIDDSFNDIAELKSYLTGNSNAAKIILLVHRMAGRTAQIGSQKLAADLRQAEIELHNEKIMTTEKTNKLLSLIIRLQTLGEYIKRKYLYNEAVV